jgi:hypothetical protein
MPLPIQASKGRKTHQPNNVNGDDMSDTTVPTGQNKNTFTFKKIEISIRMEITLKNDNKRGVHLHHTATFQAMEMSFSDDKLEIIDNNN